MAPMSAAQGALVEDAGVPHHLAGGGAEAVPEGDDHRRSRQRHVQDPDAADDLEDAVIIAVNHDGDSDSTGAIAGNLLGARDGVEAIPPRWLEPLELRDVIVEMAGDLHEFVDWDITETDEPAGSGSWVERYWGPRPGATPDLRPVG